MTWTLLLLLSGTPLAQESEASGAAHESTGAIVWDVPAVTTHQEDLGDVVVRMQVRKGARVYADKVHTAVTESKGLVLGAPKFPVGARDVKDESATEGRAWYDRTIEIEIPIIEAELGLHRVSLSLTSQACRDNICYPSTTATRDVYVHVQPGDGATAPR